MNTNYDVKAILSRLDELITDFFGSEHGRQKKFATLVGIKLSTLNNYFSRQNTPGSDTLCKISQKCKVNLNWLLTGQGGKYLAPPKPPPEPPPAPDLEKIRAALPDFSESHLRNLKTLFDKWSQLSPDQRMELRSDIEKLLLKIKDLPLVSPEAQPKVVKSFTMTPFAVLRVEDDIPSKVSSPDKFKKARRPR